MTSYPQETTDTNLVQFTAEGDAEAFRTLYDRHSTLVFSIALKILGNREEASDVLQQVFLRLHHKACLYTLENGRPASWLAAITRNQCLDRLRQMKCRRSLGEKLWFEATVAAHPRHPGGGYASYSDEVDLLHGAIAALRPEEIRVLHLAYFGALSQTEISFKLRPAPRQHQSPYPTRPRETQGLPRGNCGTAFRIAGGAPGERPDAGLIIPQARPDQSNSAVARLRSSKRPTRTRGERKISQSNPPPNMNQTKSTETLLMYVNDVLALERLIKEAVTGQIKDDDVRADSETSALLGKIATCTETRMNELKELSQALGGGAGAIKETVAAVAGVCAGLYDMVRKHPVSRMLRDDYTALALASTAYSMLYTTAVALHSDQVAAVAQRGLRKVAPLVLQVSHLIPDVVVGELAKDHPDVNHAAIAAAREATEQAWSPEVELVHG